MIIYQRNIENRILIKLEEENNSWNISKYYDKNAFFIVEKNNNYSSIINIGFCMLNGEHFKITEEGKNRKFKYENNRLYIEQVKKRNKIGYNTVNNINDVLSDIKNVENNKIYNGVSILLRIKNEESTIKNAILSIVDLVDEIIVVNNMSTDKTRNIILELEDIYDNIYCYDYNINIPSVGLEHAKHVANNSNNTFGTYYNWCLSKATRRYCIKWDGDFTGIKNNFKNMIDLYKLKTNNAKLSIWFTGASLYYNKYINLDSWYEEFRVITKTKDAKWTNYKGCETISNYVLESDELYIYPSTQNLVKVMKQEELLMTLKNNSPLIFFENKNETDFKDIKSILDGRDKVDNFFIEKYRGENNNIIINNYDILVIIPSLSTGGGNYWAQILVEHFKYFGWNTTICVIHNNNVYNFYNFNDIEVIHYNKYINFNKYSHILTTTLIDIDISNIKNKIYGFSHSDVSWVNNNYLQQLDNVICLNNITFNKFRLNGFNKNLYILNNYMKLNNNNVNKVTFNKNLIKILYCNRISFDKNLIMVLYAINNISKKFNVRLTLLAGGCEYSPIEYKSLLKTISLLELNNIINILQTQKDVSKFYNSHDFCFLPSVSEGCSYGILEAINHEIPIICTNIDANNEIINNMLPQFDYINNKNILSSTICVNNYNKFISNLGYILKTDFINNISKCLNKKNCLDIESMCIIPHELLFNINHKKLCKNCNSNFKVKYIQEMINIKKNIFDKNVLLIEDTFIDMINNYLHYKTNVIKLKKEISKTYYSKNNIRKQLLQIFTMYEGI